MKRHYLWLLAIFLSYPAWAQLSDSFTDSDFTNNPVWEGDASYFTINAAQQLQSNGPNATTSLYLSTANAQCRHTEWQFSINLSFAPSNGNHVRVYVMSDQADLKGNVNGYYVRVGEDGTADGVDLYRQQGNVHTKIIDGIAGRAATNPSLSIRVIREATGNWQLYSDNTGGSNFTKEGQVTDNTVTATAFFGIFCTFSPTRRQGFFFDDFVIRDAPFSLLMATAVGATQVKALFSQAVEAATATQLTNYSLSNGATIQAAAIDPANPAQVLLTLATPLPAGAYFLTVSGVRDLTGQTVSPNSTAPFSYAVQANRYAIIITELLVDESPQVGLPEAEFVELYNTTSQTINLKGYTLTDPGTSVLLPDYNLLPGSYVTLTKSVYQLAFEAYGPTLGLSSWPSLNNSEDQIALKSPAGQIIDQVDYTSHWYHDQAKSAGGWSLERIDVQNVCAEGDNWTASLHPLGGTPSQPNSVAASRPDLTPPQGMVVEVLNSRQLQVVFPEKMDSLTMAQSVLYQLDKGLEVVSTIPIGPHFRAVQLRLGTDLVARTVYTLVVQNAQDCTGNVNGGVLRTTFALPEPGDSGDVVLNEVLFNPRPEGVDFVEVYNRSSKYVSLQDWQLASIKDGEVANRKKITDRPLVLRPGHYAVLTSNAQVLKDQYPKAKDSTFMLLPSLPSYPDAAGGVVILNQVGRLLDQFEYSEQYHFTLVDRKEGVSLERISTETPGNTPQNWHSAASTEGYATPGYRNSQHLSAQNASPPFRIQPNVFTPDEDGFNEVTTLQYNFAAHGNVATVTIFDASGREIKKWVRNELLGTEGFYTWDGTNDQGQKVRMGRYVVYVSVFNLQGKQQDYKLEVVVGARF